ncbi:MFS transporter [Marinihelvus fidelis]|nr:MFS transporter [Marinihelvus fidelis]
MSFLTDLKPDLRWLASGFLLMMFSGFGQTYYIALFAGHIKADLTLTDGSFGALYAVATLASAVVLTWAGKLADTIPIRWLSAGVMAGLALTAVLMAYTYNAWVLALALFGLRFFGQGMLTLTAMTAMGRWFNRKRGRAVAVAAMGMPSGQAFLPAAAVAVMVATSWRQSWLYAALMLAVVGIPLFLYLLHHERHPTRGPMARAGHQPDDRRHQWTRSEVLRHASFYLLMPVILAPPFILTAVFFYQVNLVELRGWRLEMFASTFSLLAIVNVFASLTAGSLVDRFGARRLLATYLVPMGIATLLLGFSGSVAVLLVVMALFGVTMGCASATSGALWAELYGITHLGSIRAVVTALVVISTAVAPGLVGLLLDAGVALELQLLAMGGYSLLMAGWAVWLVPRLGAIALSDGIPAGG